MRKFCRSNHCNASKFFRILDSCLQRKGFLAQKALINSNVRKAFYEICLAVWDLYTPFCFHLMFGPFLVLICNPYTIWFFRTHGHFDTKLHANKTTFLKGWRISCICNFTFGHRFIFVSVIPLCVKITFNAILFLINLTTLMLTTFLEINLVLFRKSNGF